jgi:hypothetical protein
VTCYRSIAVGYVLPALRGSIHIYIPQPTIYAASYLRRGVAWINFHSSRTKMPPFLSPVVWNAYNSPH